MQYARDNLDLDPHWHLCEGCDRDGAFTPDADGLCPECAAKKRIAERIWAHYDHAKEKHPYFCDKLLPVDLDEERRDGTLADYYESVSVSLADIRAAVAEDARRGELLWNVVLLCRMWAIDDAVAHDDTARAVDECYDAIAVLLRTIDVLEGRQRLGKPETTGEMK